MNPATLEVLLDATWRLAGAETDRTDALDRKAATIATFASVVAAITATLGIRLVEALSSWWAFGLLLSGLMAFLCAVAAAVRALWPREYLTLGREYLRRFPTWGEIRKPADQVRGEMMTTLVQTITRERSVNDTNVVWIRRSFLLLLLGVGLAAVQGATLAREEVLR